MSHWKIYQWKKNATSTHTERGGDVGNGKESMRLMRHSKGSNTYISKSQKEWRERKWRRNNIWRYSHQEFAKTDKRKILRSNWDDRWQKGDARQTDRSFKWASTPAYVVDHIKEKLWTRKKLKWHIQSIKQNNDQPRLLYSVKISFKNKGEMERYSKRKRIYHVQPYIKREVFRRK